MAPCSHRCQRPLENNLLRASPEQRSAKYKARQSCKIPVVTLSCLQILVQSFAYVSVHRHLAKSQQSQRPTKPANSTLTTIQHDSKTDETSLQWAGYLLTTYYLLYWLYTSCYPLPDSCNFILRLWPRLKMQKGMPKWLLWTLDCAAW